MSRLLPVLGDAARLALCFAAGAATVWWLGDGIWARLFAVSSALTVWLLPAGMPYWLAARACGKADHGA